VNAALVVVGRVMRPFGIRGELKVALETDFPDVLRQRRELIVTRDGVSGSPAAVESVRMHQGAALVKLSGVDTRTDAEDLRGALLAVREEDRPELEEGRFWLDDIIGLEAVFDFHPQIVLYQAGVDVLAEDRLGRLCLTMEGIKERDRMVLGKCFHGSIPIVLVMGGGYASPIERTAQAHVQTYRVAKEIYRL